MIGHSFGVIAVDLDRWRLERSERLSLLVWLKADPKTMTAAEPLPA
jgi:hypothetical protein